MNDPADERPGIPTEDVRRSRQPEGAGNATAPALKRVELVCEGATLIMPMMVGLLAARSAARARFPASAVLWAGGHMNRFAYLMVTGLALAASPRADMSTSSVHLPAGDVEILVGDVPQPRYAHAGRWYIEARNGSEYAIRLRNPYGVRVAVAL